ncbi:MAG: transporter substrate-binding domain-containing protein [Erysipelotrichaceae bacterium]|nr:transporter substrate-binding domain-containing protein [Erysipelotrichaceae bacterium]
MKNIRTLIALLFAFLLLTACGTPKAPDTPVLRVGMECNYAPFNWTTTEQSDTTRPINEVDYADGYDVVIASMIGTDIGMDTQIVKLDWDNLILALQNDQIDLVIAGMTDTPTRREQVNFTTPYYVSE